MDDRRPPNPYRPDPPLFPPDDDGPEDEPLVRPRRRREEHEDLTPRFERDAPAPVFDDGNDSPPAPPGEPWRWDEDDEFDDFGGRRSNRGRGDGGGGYASDRGLVRIVALLAVLGAIVAALVLPWSPVRVIGRDSTAPTGTDGITASARDNMPTLPNGFTALSKLYDVRVPDGAKGPWSIEVTLTQATQDASNLGMYAYDGSRWTRIANVALAPGGTAASGDVASPPGALAVLRRTGQAKALALIVQAGDRLDTRALDATSIVAVMGASVGNDGALQATNGALQGIAPSAGKAKVYLGVSDGTETQGLVKALSSTTLQGAHAESIAAAAKSQNAAGVYLDYRNLPGAQKDAFSAFVKMLRERLQRDQLGLVIGIPGSAGANGAYDWNALAGSADGIWLRGVADPAVYYDQMEQLLSTRKAGNTDLAKVSLILDRRSVDRRAQQMSQLSLRDALTIASTIDPKAEATAAAAGGTVALRALNLGDAQQGAGLRWDTTARSVAFAYNAADGAHNVWIENRFSAAFRMDLASRLGLAGIVVDQAKQDDALPDLWSTALLFAQDGSVKLERPFGPYLAPCWSAAQGTVEGSKCWSADATPASVNWRAPQQSGTYNVRLVVSDGTTFVGQELGLRVGTATPTPTPTGTATPTPTATARPGGTTPAPTSTPTPRPTTAPTAAPTATPAPTSAPTPPPIQTSTPVPSTTPPPATTPPTTFPGGVPPGPAGQ